jgi:hypothetical protein
VRKGGWRSRPSTDWSLNDTPAGPVAPAGRDATGGGFPIRPGNLWARLRGPRAVGFGIVRRLRRRLHVCLNCACTTPGAHSQCRRRRQPVVEGPRQPLRLVPGKEGAPGGRPKGGPRPGASRLLFRKAGVPRGEADAGRPRRALQKEETLRRRPQGLPFDFDAVRLRRAAGTRPSSCQCGARRRSGRRWGPGR